MKLKLDENLPTSLVEELALLGHDADSVPQEGLQGHPDPDVFDAAQQAGRFLITQDLDFSDLRKFAPPSPGYPCQGASFVLHFSNAAAPPLIERDRKSVV